MTGIYVIFCHEDGTLIDDSILYKFSDNDYLLMPSDMDHSAYFDSLVERIQFQAVSILDCTDKWVGMAIQGPLSAAVLLSMGCENLDQLVPYEVRQFHFAGSQIQIARMGFTADLGYECWLKPGLASEFMAAIELARESMDLAIPGYGLSTLEACRLEGGFIVAGWDFATEADPAPGFERNPFEVGLGWLVELDGVDFVGKNALVEKKREGSQYAIRGFQTTDAQELEDGAAIYGREDGAEIIVGSVNGSTWSWGLQNLIGNASIYTEHLRTRDLWIRVKDQAVKITLRRGPFINLDRRTQVPAPLA
jgi:aminomethyltransferase